MEHPFESLSKKELKSDAELIAFLAVTRISHQLPIGIVLSLPASQRTPEQVYDSLLREARTLWDSVPRQYREQGPQAEVTGASGVICREGS